MVFLSKTVRSVLSTDQPFVITLYGYVGFCVNIPYINLLIIFFMEKIPNNMLAIITFNSNAIIFLMECTYICNVIYQN
jgi:hypothetical protein